MTTREDDVLFSSWINTIVTSTIFAQENKIDKATSSFMPLVFVFGEAMNWDLKDAISYSGNHDEIYQKNFGKEESNSN